MNIRPLQKKRQRGERPTQVGDAFDVQLDGATLLTALRVSEEAGWTTFMAACRTLPGTGHVQLLRGGKPVAQMRIC